MAYTPGINGGRINLGVNGTAGAMSTGTAVISGGSNITLAQAGNTITINAAGDPISRWEYPNQVFAPLATVPQGSLSIQHMFIPFHVAASAMKVGGMLAVGSTTGTAAGVRTGSMSLWMGLYTLNGSTLQSLVSGSANNTVSWNGSNVTASHTAAAGMRQLTVPIANTTITAGEYWVAAAMSMSAPATNQSLTFTMYGNNQITNGANNAILAPLNSDITAARDVILFQGIYKTATTAGPATISGAQIENMAASAVQRANFYNAIYNATY